MSDLGLVVTIYDILDIQGGSIYASEGAAHYTVKFRLVVFRPFIGELLVGRLTKCDKCALLIPPDNPSSCKITVHRAQGSSLHVAVKLADQQAPILDATWLQDRRACEPGLL